MSSRENRISFEGAKGFTILGGNFGRVSGNMTNVNADPDSITRFIPLLQLDRQGSQCQDPTSTRGRNRRRTSGTTTAPAPSTTTTHTPRLSTNPRTSRRNQSRNNGEGADSVGLQGSSPTPSPTITHRGQYPATAFSSLVPPPPPRPSASPLPPPPHRLQDQTAYNQQHSVHRTPPTSLRPVLPRSPITTPSSPYSGSAIESHHPSPPPLPSVGGSDIVPTRPLLSQRTSSWRPSHLLPTLHESPCPSPNPHPLLFNTSTGTLLMFPPRFDPATRPHEPPNPSTANMRNHVHPPTLHVQPEPDGARVPFAYPPYQDAPEEIFMSLETASRDTAHYAPSPPHQL